MRMSRRLSTVICTAHTSYRAATYPAARCQRFLSTSTDGSLPEIPPDAATRIRFIKSRSSLPEPEDGPPPETDNSVRRMLRHKFPGEIKMRQRERKAAKQGKSLKVDMVKTDQPVVDNKLVQATAQHPSTEGPPIKKSGPDTKTWRVKKGKQKNETLQKPNKPPPAKGFVSKASNERSIYPIPTHLGNITDASLGKANSRYAAVSYDAILDAVLTLSPGLVIKILQLKSVRLLRDAYLHNLIKEGLRKGDLIYYRTNGAIRIKKEEWTQKLHALRIKRDILACYSVDLETKDIMFDYKHAAKIFGGHEFPTDSRAPGIPWVLNRRRSLTLRPGSDSYQDKGKTMKEIGRASGGAVPTTAGVSSEALEPMVDPQEVPSISNPQVAPGSTEIQEGKNIGEESSVVGSTIPQISGTKPEGTSIQTVTAETSVVEPSPAVILADETSPGAMSAKSKPSAPSPQTPLEDGYEYLRSGR
ncbi:hypothetical protein TWF481_001997 [Arthrobotrys musiformis]|uniref:Uncharacterized protein n=1 Tax=Arthrobotrys musiformis TaxID=47236 RepID=A0AAV9VV38_9PEZI